MSLTDQLHPKGQTTDYLVSVVCAAQNTKGEDSKLYWWFFILKYGFFQNAPQTLNFTRKSCICFV